LKQDEVVAQLLGMAIAAVVAGWVSADAQRRGLKKSTALGWGVGVLLVLIVFLPLYLYMRRKDFEAGNAPSGAATAPCPYCGYLNKPGANYCEKCNRQLRSSADIHRK
jgi:hypothetical protein